MPLYTVDGKLLVRFGKLAAGEDCCDCACDFCDLDEIDLLFDGVQLCRETSDYMDDNPNPPREGSHTLSSDSEINDIPYAIPVQEIDAGPPPICDALEDYFVGDCLVKHYLVGHSGDKESIGDADRLTIGFVTPVGQDPAVFVQIGVSGSAMPGWLFFGRFQWVCEHGIYVPIEVDNEFTTWCPFYADTPCPGLTGASSYINDYSLVLGKLGSVTLTPVYK